MYSSLDDFNEDYLNLINNSAKQVKERSMLKLKQIVEYQYDVMLYCLETGDSREATMEDLLSIVEQQTDLRVEGLIKENIDLQNQIDSLKQQLNIALLQNKPCYCPNPFNPFPAYEFTCNSNTSVDTFVETTCNSSNTAIFNYDSNHVTKIPNDICSVIPCVSNTPKTGYIKYGEENNSDNDDMNYSGSIFNSLNTTCKCYDSSCSCDINKETTTKNNNISNRDSWRTK